MRAARQLGRFASQVRPQLAVRLASSLVTKFEDAVAALPMREAVRYTGKNLKWTASELKGFVDAHANALLEHGFVKGDALAVWLPNSAEKHVTLLAAAKIGLKVVDVDPSLSAVADLRQVLSFSACKAIFFEPVSATQDNLLLLRKAIPEFFYCKSDDGHFYCFPAVETNDPPCLFTHAPRQMTTNTARSSTPSTFPHSSISSTPVSTSRQAVSITSTCFFPILSRAL